MLGALALVSLRKNFCRITPDTNQEAVEKRTEAEANAVANSTFEYYEWRGCFPRPDPD